MANPLVIVESPAKAKTIERFLGDGYTVESSVGHIRDLATVKTIPAQFKGEPWANLAIDVENDFKPVYVVSSGKSDVVKRLRKLMAQADELYLATDEDREGEAIAWHLLEVLNPPEGMPVKRMVFHEITPQAIAEAVNNTRDIDRRLVDAQETRRLLDRLYGFGLSEVLWRKVSNARSAGRVQSVAVRLVVERERERIAFVGASYWNIEGSFTKSDGAETGAGHEPFSATLVALDGERLATGRDFNNQGALSKAGLALLDEQAARELKIDLEGADFTVRSVESKPYRRRPAAPFMTSTFQQEAGRKLRMSAQQAMRAAQSLYENGYITYMRTDSTTLSETALTAARREIRARYGDENLPDAPRRYAKKVKNAQEAHEAIRPAGDDFRSPEQVAKEVNASEAKVYELIWKRTIASQMTDATGETVTVRLGAQARSGRDAEFATTGTVIGHHGFLLAYREGTDDDDASGDSERRLPPVAEGDHLDVIDLEPVGHETSPPARYTEASLVKKLEELGVGRPSTYAAILNTIEARDYVWKKGSALVPSVVAFALTGLLEQHFTNLVDYTFTARMEDDLDAIARGDAEMVPWLSDFYFGPVVSGERSGGLNDAIHGEHLDEIDARLINSIPLGVDDSGIPIEVRNGRYGPFLSRGDDTATIPDDLPLDELTVSRAVELLAAPKGGRELGVDPDTGLSVTVKSGRFGPYVQLGEPDENAKQKKPKMASLFKTMSIETVSLVEALQLLSLPRVVGVDPADGIEITAQNGKFGPYLQKIGPDGKKDSRSIESEEQLLTLTLEEALAIFSQPKTRRGQVAKPPLRELGVDPVSGKAMIVKDGRFGPYVTDGETNASLRKGDDPVTITDERASELLADRRERGPAKKATRKKSAAKKSATKKSAAKKSAAKKSATKKSAAKKSATKKSATKKSATKKPATKKPAGKIVADGATMSENASNAE